jgi:hypothetical protein
MRAQISEKAYGKGHSAAAFKARDDIPQRDDIPGLRPRRPQW